MSTIQPWQEVSSEQAFKKYSRVIDKVIFKLPDGSESDFYLKAEGPAACMLALTPENKVILVRQVRPGPRKVLLELPGGYVDPNESPELAAAREFREETGFEGTFELIGTCLDDAYSSMVRYCFVANDCRRVGEPQHTSTEQTEVVVLPLAEFRALLRSGEMTDVEVGYLGLDYLNLL
jgi:ADP-ribose pyrophosphatase